MWVNEGLLTTGNIVGYIKYPFQDKVHEINVSSRFGNEFLKSLINISDGFLEVEDFGAIGDIENITEWLLIYLWKTKLKHAYRLGLPKVYAKQKEYLVGVRGNLDINGLIINPKFIPPYLCNFREHDYNNPVTQLIATAFKVTKHKQLIQDCLRIKQDFIIATEGLKPNIKELMLYNGIKNPFYSEYNLVVRLSKMIIRNELADFSSETSNFSAFFFDVSMLFEYFIRKILLRSGYSLEEKKADIYSIPHGGKSNSGMRRLFPDIIIRTDSGELEIFDIKYKRFNFTYGMDREDLFQLHTYFGNLMNMGIVARAGFIMPITESEYLKNDLKGAIQQTLKIAGISCPFEIHFFIVPDEGTANYISAFNIQVNHFITTFNSKVL